MLWLERGEEEMALKAFKRADTAGRGFMATAAEPYSLQVEDLEIHIEIRVI